MNKLTHGDIIKLPPYELFDYQLEIIEERFPEEIVETVAKARNIILSKAVLMRVPYGNLYFAPVIVPSGKIGTKELMQMVEHNGEKGVIALNESKLRDVERVPSSLYFMFNVEDGSDTRGKPPRLSEKMIRSENRNRLTAIEGINLCIIMDVLSKLNIDCTGSRCEKGLEVPHICITKNIPTLGKSDICDENQEWGSPSCTGRHAI